MRYRSLYQTVYLCSLLFSLNTCASKPSPPNNPPLPTQISVSDSILPPDSEIKAPHLIPPTAPIIEITPQYTPSQSQNVEVEQTVTPTISNQKVEIESEIEQKEQNQDVNHSLDAIIEAYTKNNSQDIEQQGLNKKIIIYKQQHLLEVYFNDHKLKSYTISLGDFIGNKEREGDNKTPEGTYYIAQKNPDSQFYKALLLSYPSPEDAKRGELNGLISKSESQAIQNAQQNCQLPPQTTLLGSYIEIHGGRDTREAQDWTWGCVALKNDEIDEIYQFADQGCTNGQKRTLVEIKP